EKENNYIGNIYDFDYCYTISFSDITTGEIYAKIVNHDNESLISEIVSYGLKEVIVNDKVSKIITNILKNQYKITISIVNDLLEDKNYDYIYQKSGDVRYETTIKHL